MNSIIMSMRLKDVIDDLKDERIKIIMPWECKEYRYFKVFVNDILALTFDIETLYLIFHYTAQPDLEYDIIDIVNGQEEDKDVLEMVKFQIVKYFFKSVKKGL